MRFVPVLALAAALTACGHSHAIKPDSGNVKVSRQAPGSNCKDLGVVTGRVKNQNGSFEEAIRDMQLDTARLGGNYVQMGVTGGQGQSVNGRAYECD